MRYCRLENILSADIKMLIYRDVPNPARLFFMRFRHGTLRFSPEQMPPGEKESFEPSAAPQRELRAKRHTLPRAAFQNPYFRTAILIG
jgi:hypothetical protein